MASKPTIEALQAAIAKLRREIDARQQREADLRQAQKRMTRIIADIPIATFFIDADHMVVHYNAAMEKLTGIPAEEIVGTRDPWRVFYKNQRPTMADLILDGATEKELSRYYENKSHKSAVKEGAFEAEIFFPDIGEKGRWLFITAAPILDDRGDIIGAIESLQDTTERNHAQAARRKSEQRMRMLLEFAPYAILVYDLAFRVEYVNPTFAEIFGWTQEELREQKVPYVPQSLRQENQLHLDKLFKDQKIERYETKRLTKDGRLLDVVWRASVFPDAQGNPAGFLVFLRDITQFKRITRNNEAMLNISLALPEYPELGELLNYISGVVKDLLDTEGGMVIMYDEEQQRLYMPAAIYDDSDTQERVKTISFKMDEMVSAEVIRTGRPMILNDSAGDSQMHIERDKKLGYHTRNLILVPIRSQDRIIGTLCGVNKKEGRFDQTDVELLEMLAGTVALSIENARFAAEIQQAYREVRDMNRAKDKIINHLSHEIKTPLAILRTSILTLEKRLSPLPTESWQPTIDRARRNIERLLDMQYEIDDIMMDKTYKRRHMQSHIVKAYADELEALIVDEYGEGPGVRRIRQRLEELYGLQVLPLQQIRLDTFVAQRLEILRPLHAHRQVVLSTRLEAVPPVLIPISVMQKIIDGLVKNAVENTPDEGRIQIATRPHQQSVLLEVADYGIGISETQQTQIFEGFISTHATMQYARKRPFDFRAGGKGADLLRLKIFSERYHFSVGLKSSRCAHLPLEGDLCPGKISACRHCRDGHGCHMVPATVFSLIFPPAAAPAPADPV